MENLVEDDTRVQPSAVHSLLDDAFDWFFSIFIFITVFLPGGSIHGVNFKYPVYAGLLPLAAYRLFRHRQATAAKLALLLAVPAALSGWIILGLSHGFNLSGVLRQFADMLLTLLVCWLVSMFCDKEESRRLRFLSLAVNAAIATAVLKLSLIAYAVFRGIPVVQMVLWLDGVFGVDLMTMDLGSLFGRVQFISDELIPVCIFVVLRFRERLKIGNSRASLAILLLLGSVLFSFSRYFWGFTALAFVLGLLLGKRDRFQAVIIFVLAVSVVASLPALVALYQLRFSTEVAGESDILRNGQISALKDFFIDAPFFGHGLGSYTTQNIRGSTEAGRASYEVQLLALPAQIGLVGMCFYIALALYYYSRLWWNSPLLSLDRLGIFLLLMFWFAAGFTNPLLFHPVAGVNYAMLAILSKLTARDVQRVRRLRSQLIPRPLSIADTHEPF